MTDNYGDKSYGGETQSDCSDWYASHDHMPPGPKKLHVTGKCTFPTAGYSVELKPADPQGINPEIYLLEKIVTEPTGPAATVITTVEVQYDEQTDTEYKQVQIIPDGGTIDVEHTE
jgi:hypothetical protein